MPGRVSNPEILASGLQCSVRPSETMIAILPQIGTGNTPVTASSAPKGAGKSANLPFSSVLEQANPSANEPLAGQADTGRDVVQGLDSPLTGPAKCEGRVAETKSSESRSADSKTNDLQKGTANPTVQDPASSLLPQVVTVPVVLVQPQVSVAQPWNAEIKDFGSGPATVADRSSANQDVAGPTTSLPTPSKVPTPGKLQKDATDQDSPSAASAESTNMDSAKAETIKAVAIKPEAVAGLVSKPSGTAASDSKTQPANAALASRTIPRGTAESTEGVHQSQAAVKSAIEQSLVPPVVTPAQGSPAPGKLENGSSQGMRTKPVLDKARVGVTQESSGTNRKTVDVAGSAKAQPRKDDAPPSGGSTVDDQATATTPAKPVASTTAFSVAGIQPSTSAADGKSSNVGVPHEGSDLPGQLDQKSTGVVQSQAQGESSSPYPTSVVHSAKLVERMGETELRLGIRAGEFGSVDVRTSMVRNQFTAEISTERGELGRALAAELPSLQNRLTDQRVPVANITLQSHTGSHSGPPEQQNPRQGQPVYPTNPGSGREEGLMPAMVASEATVEASRLDIRM